MATAVPYKDKDGNIVSFQIQVLRGRDSSGKKIKPYTDRLDARDNDVEKAVGHVIDNVAER